jgi:VWFA-related protein
VRYFGAFLFGLCFAHAQQVSITPRSQPKQASKQTEESRANIRVDTTMVLIPVEVSDQVGHPVTGLEKSDFRIADDKSPQIISSFATEDEPVAVCVVFDRSSSVAPSIGLSRRTVAEFFKSANPEDEFCLIEFASVPKLVVPLSQDNGSDITYKVGLSKPVGSTAMFDGIYLALHEVRKSKKQKRALLLVTDGDDNNSRYTMSEVHNVIQESDVLIYSVGVGTQYGEGLLKRMSEETGGRYFAGSFADLPDIAEKVAVDLRNRYLLGFSPTNAARDGRYHKVEVKVVPPPGLPPLKVSWRRGYYAPME